MGQKINPTIFRLSHTNRWPCKYIEKKSSDSGLYNYKDIEIREFIVRFFNSFGLIVQNLKISYLNNSLNIFVSYFTTLKTPFLITGTLNKSQKIKFVTKDMGLKNKSIKKYENDRYTQIKNYSKYKEFDYAKLTTTNTQLLKKEKQTLKLRRIKFLKYYKNYVLTRKHKCIYNIKSNFFLYKFFESVSAFTNKQCNISLTAKPLNSDIKQEFTKKNIKTFKKDLIKLRKYDQNEFFKEGINILFLCSIRKNSAKLLSYFIAYQLKKFKKHNFFLRFIKNVLVLFNNRVFSKLEGIKIKIKGRFNKAPRARSKILTIGKDIPALTLKARINYAETTSFTANGTFGVKVWICEKK
jgi:ribosomal protein S3